MDGSAGRFDLATVKREPVDIPEPRRQDKSLPKLISVHKRRLERMEWETRQARANWRALRETVRTVKDQWRAAKQHALDFWTAARTEFFQMVISSGKVRIAKAVYERKKIEAEQIHLKSREAAQAARQAGHEYFVAKATLRAQHLHCEKFDILQKILHAKNNPVE